MIDKTPIPGLDMNNTEAKAQINNFWNYLDELAANNPEEYKKFIQTQMQKGISMAAQAKKETNNNSTTNNNNVNNNNIDDYLNEIASKNILTKKEFQVFPFMCLSFKPTKIIKKNLEEDIDKPNENNNIILKDIKQEIQNEIKEIDVIKFNNSFLDCAFQSPVIQDRKIYLNIIYAEDFYPPTDEKGNFLKESEISDPNNWKYIPTEFRYDGKKDSLLGVRCDFYDVIITKIIIDKIKQNSKLCNNILDYIVRKFVIFTRDKFKLFTSSVKILKNKMYKGIDGRPPVFKSKLEMEKKITNSPIETNNESKNNNNKKDDIIIASKAQYEQNQFNDNYIKQSDKNDKTENSLPELKLRPENEKDKKNVVIQEVGAEFKQIIPMKRKILSENQMEVKFFFDEFEYLRGMKDIDLQISENGIIIHLDNDHYLIDRNYEPVEMKFDFKVDPDKCTAKYSKKEKTLTVIIYRI